MANAMDNRRRPRDNRRLSLYPLDFTEAVEAVLQVEPPPKPARKGRPKKKPPKKDGAKS